MTWHVITATQHMYQQALIPPRVSMSSLVSVNEHVGKPAVQIFVRFDLAGNAERTDSEHHVKSMGSGLATATMEAVMSAVKLILMCRWIPRSDTHVEVAPAGLCAFAVERLAVSNLSV